MPIEQDILLTNEPYQVTPEQAELRARKAYDIALKEQLPVGYIEKNMELYDSGAYREKVNEWKHKIENAPDEERSKMMFWSQAGNIFNITSYMSRKGWLFTEENRGNTSAFFDAMEEYHRDMKRPTINVLGKEIRLPHPAYVAGGVVRAATEFEAIPIGAEKAATWMGRMGETAGKFAAQTTLQAPTERESAMPAGEFIKQKAGAAVKSAITGAGVSVVGKYVPNPFFRIPTVTGGFMSLTALEGGTAEEVLTTGVNILGFELLGMAQQAVKGKADMKQVVAVAKETKPEFKDVPDSEIERILKETINISEQKGTADGLQEKGQKEGQVIAEAKTGAESTTAPIEQKPIKPFVPVEIKSANTKDDILNVVEQLVTNPLIDEGFSFRHEDLKRYSEVMGTDGIPSLERVKFQEALQEAKDRNIAPQSLNMATEVLAGTKTLNPAERAGMTIRLAQLMAKNDILEDKLDKATDEVEISDIKIKQDILQKEFDTIKDAAATTGSLAGQSLSFQRLTINDKYDLMSVKNRAKKMKGKDLTEKEVEKLSLRVKELEIQNKKISEEYENHKKNNAQKIVNSGKKKYEEMTKEEVDATIGNLTDELQRMIKEGC